MRFIFVLKIIIRCRPPSSCLSAFSGAEGKKERAKETAQGHLCFRPVSFSSWYTARNEPCLSGDISLGSPPKQLGLPIGRGRGRGGDRGQLSGQCRVLPRNRTPQNHGDQRQREEPAPPKAKPGAGRHGLQRRNKAKQVSV